MNANIEEVLEYTTSTLEELKKINLKNNLKEVAHIIGVASLAAKEAADNNQNL